MIEDDTREDGAGSLDKDEVVAKKRLGSNGVNSLTGTQDGRLESVPDVGGSWRLPSTSDAVCIQQVAQYLMEDGSIEGS